MSNRTIFIIFNILAFEIVWAICAFGAINNASYLGVISGVIYILIHFTYTQTRLLDAIIMLSVATVGIAMDSVNLYFGLISFNSDNQMLPLWMITIWFSFSLILPHSLKWLSNYPLLAIIFGAIGGGGSYFIGHQLGAVYLSSPLYLSLIVYCIQWAILVPAALWLITYTNNFLLAKGYARST